MDNKTKDVILSLLHRGLGRRKIANQLGLTEWAVRKVMDEVAQLLEIEEQAS